jgi:hypothetical protein
MGDFLVVSSGELVEGKKRSSALKLKWRALLLAKYQVSVTVADDEELQEAQQRSGVAVAGVVLVINDLAASPGGG